MRTESIYGGSNFHLGKTLRTFERFSNTIIYCRPGFEQEAAEELRACTETDDGKKLFDKITPMKGYVLATSKSGAPLRALAKITFDRLIFARQMLFGFATVRNLPERNKLEPIMAVLAESLPNGSKFSQVMVETIDLDQGNEIGKFCKTFQPHMERALKKAELLTDRPPGLPRLHVFFPDYKHCQLAVSFQDNSSAWNMGIPRLRLPKDAPSRAWLKIDEAMQVLLGESERAHLLRPGMKAVDLGAAPGGWTRYLIDKGMVVWAVDHANLAKAIAESDHVHHERSNALTFKAPTHIDWLVCDMVEQPRRVADLICRWFKEHRCRYALFNLKLPMKKRFAETERCLSHIHQQLPRGSGRFVVRAKQLYHDRKEISVLILPEKL